MEDQVNMIFNSHAEMMRNMGVKQTRRQQKERMKPEALNYMGMAVIYLSGAYFVIHDQMELGTFFAFVSSVNLLMGPIMTMMQLNLIRGNAEAGLERIQRILAVRESTVEPADDQTVDLDRQMEIAKAKNLPAVEFKNVCFGYDDKSDVLKNINCRIRHGESIALVGPSGSGKSTFVSLLLRLYDPTEGEILLNDADIRNYNSRELRSRFGVVPQSPFLFQASIADNIRVTNPAATKQQIKHAMDIAHVTEFVDEMPDGVETTLGESGFNLSGGQRQRISIARAALQQSEYFVFDEATSALDNASEDLIMQTMKELTEGHTTLIIAHRLSTVKHVDRVFVFENGRIVQTGTYQELARTEGLFKDLHQRGQVVT
jgi:ABC-type multidrug transport system fused ATPase/permease subunit